MKTAQQLDSLSTAWDDYISNESQQRWQCSQGRAGNNLRRSSMTEIKADVIEFLIY